VGAGLLLMGLQAGSHDGWLTPLVLAELLGALALLALFVLIERRATAPILSLSVLARPLIAVPCLSGMMASSIIIGFAAYVPLLVQGAWGGIPIEAGLIVAPLSIGWPIASMLSGTLITRFGFRALAVWGSAIIVLGTLFLLGVQIEAVAHDPLLRSIVVVAAAAISGFGLGLSTTSMLIAVQSSVSWKERGITTASVQFFRNMGQALGAAALGAVLSATLAPMLATAQAKALLSQVPATLLKPNSDPALGPANVLFDLKTRDMLTPPVRTLLADALAGSLWWVFVGLVILAATGALMAMRFPREVQEVER
ncbi:MAG: hypothetical protein M3014_11550, partial [Chloroflexota bacterium]|nr:hypothetical protein [Chloroflexota bacterium]